MIIDHPDLGDIPALRALWKEAFPDTDAFLELFFTQAFAPERALAVKEGNEVLAALYWFDCKWEQNPCVYVYAVATQKEHRGKGICRALMAQLHKEMDMAGKSTVLVPANDGLREFYARLGYENFGGMETLVCYASAQAVTAEKLTAEAYAQKRRVLLPKGGILQEEETLRLLQNLYAFYGGENWLLAGCESDGMWIFPEFLGEKNLLPGILQALEISFAKVSVAGKTPFAMFRAGKEGISAPGYFAFALD